MKDGCVRCPQCGRPVQLIQRTGQMRSHWATLSKPGIGFHGNAQKCKASNKRPEDVK